jgi:hypothetical protein
VLLRARRARIILAAVALIVIAAISLAVYALAPFRVSFDRAIPGRTGAPHTTQPLGPSSRGPAVSAQR